jgi:hypothetical protein
MSALELTRQAREAHLPPPEIVILEGRGQVGRRQNYVGLHTQSSRMLLVHDIDLGAHDFGWSKGTEILDEESGPRDWQLLRRQTRPTWSWSAVARRGSGPPSKRD